MAAAIPKIQVIDSQNSDSIPTSPPIPSPDHDGSPDGDAARPRSRDKTDTSTSGKSSPTKQQASSKSPLQLGIQSPQNGSSEKQIQSPVAIDPLSQHILNRTGAQTTTPQKLRSPIESSNVQSLHFPGGSDADAKHTIGIAHSETFGSINKEKDKRKGVSFLSRFIGSNKKKGFDDDMENASEAGDFRPEGTDAQLFSQPIDNIGFNPQHPQPPAYIRVRSKHKKEKEFNRVFLAQELLTNSGTKKRLSTSSITGHGASSVRAGGNPIWALEFSKDGKYLAAGGQDRVVRVWSVISTPEERRAHEKEEEMSTSSHLSAPVFQKKTLREYEGHTSTILDLSWSKNNFLLSSSMDKTVRLWHISRPECLCTFKHTDFVPSIQFHPRDDRFFLAGSLDSRLRLWSIPDKSIAFWSQLPDMITAVSFTPDGKTAIAGTLNGLCQFFDTEGLKYQTQIHVRSNRGRNTKGSKITGIQAFTVPPDGPGGEFKLLISSNDSRIRLYNFRDKSLELKLKGHENNYSQIRASASDDFKYIICGSEDRKAYIFSTLPTEGDRRNQRPIEMFEAHNSITTAAVFAPTNTKQLLSNSEDPVYDICNPPPVTLVSRAESIISSHVNTENGSAAPTPAESTFKRAEESPAYLARTLHSGGNIIVTADFTGCIKVFRQDCAFQKRRSDLWETSSLISRRVNSIKGGRPLSIATRGSGRSRRDSTSTQPSSDRILSWRQDIMSSPSLDNLRTTTRSKNRSVSPRKSIGASTPSTSRLRNDMSSDSPQGGTNSTMGTFESTTTLVTSSPQSSRLGMQESNTTSPVRSTSESNLVEKTGEQKEVNPLWVQNNQSYAFYNPSLYKTQPGQAEVQTEYPLASPQLPELVPKRSIVSALSSELSSEDGDQESRAAELKCKKCGGTSFRARFVDFGASHQLVCSRCGIEASDR